MFFFIFSRISGFLTISNNIFFKFSSKRSSLQINAFICKEDLLEENLKKILFEIVKNPEILEKMKKNISRISLTDKKNIIVKKILSNE